MKKFRRIMALLLATVMVLSMGAVAFASETETHTYTVADPSEEDVTTGHTYKAYQIFKADSITEDGELGNIAWADGVTDAGKTALLGDKADIKALAESLGTDDSAAAVAFAKLAYKNKDKLGTPVDVTSGTTILGMGYWVIVDESTAANVKVVNWATLYQSDGKEAISIVSKVDAPSSDKKVKDTNDSKANSTTDWQRSADYDIGDKVPFQLTATLPGNYTDYETYHLTFHDKECTGLTFDESSVKVYVGDSATPVNAANYTVKTTDIGEDTFQILFDYAGLTAMNVTNSSVIRVEYESELNEDAEIGLPGNPNTSNITYDNNPNSDQDGEEGGTTPAKTAIVFTYKVVINKVDKDGASLEGAEFTLTKTLAGGTTKTIAVIKLDEDGNPEVVSGTGADATSNATKFSFNGLDDGTYTLKETKTPEGYNTMPDYTFEVVATHTANDGTAAALTDLAGKKVSGEITLTFDKDLAEGSLTEDVINQKGAVLPSTGGIGTTMFYIIGAIMVIGAGVVLISRRRMNVQ